MDQGLPAARVGPQRTDIIVHRAAAGGAAENSLAGLHGCVHRGFPWAEVDVRCTRDGVHVLLHDATLDRTTNGSGPVSEQTLAQVQALTLKPAADGVSGQRVPRLSDALAVARGRLGLYLDGRDVDPRRLAAELAAAGMQTDVIVCLEPPQAAELRAVDRAIRLVVYCAAWDADIGRALESLAPAVVESPGGALDVAISTGARGRGAEVIGLALGDADTPAVWRNAVAVGARWIMTDQPDDVRSLLGAGPA